MSVKVAVFVCECGTNIASVVDVSAVAGHAGSLADVVVSEEGRWICAVDYLEKLKDIIQEHKVDKVVVACCSPRTHEAIFRSAIEEAGLNPNLLEFVSIREGCSWVHKAEPEAATDKAKNLVEMAVAKARLLEPAEPMRIPVGDTSMVIGGGPAGLSAAAALAEHGFKVVLVERSAKLGGLLNQLTKIAPDERPAEEVLAELIEKVQSTELIDVRTETALTEVKGYVGNFKVGLNSPAGEDELDIATIIIATGMRELPPLGTCGYGSNDNIITLLEFEKLIKNKDSRLDKIKSIAFINCINSRNDERGCCNIGCLSAVKNLSSFKSANPDSEAYLFHRDLILPGPEEHYLDKGRLASSAFIRYQEGTLPQVEVKDDGTLSVSAHDTLLEEDVAVNADLVVLVTAFTGDSSAEELKKLLRVSVGQDNFFQEAHVKLKPVDFATDGIYLAGAAKSPKSLKETIEEALGTAMRAAIPMKRGYIESSGLIAEIDSDKCINCELCAESCAYGAVEMLTDQPEAEAAGDAIPAREFRIIEALCKGCGNCVAGCPEHAITMRNFTDAQLEAQLEAGLESAPEQKQLAFCCHWCALGAADLAGVSRLQYPPNLRIIRVMCSGRVDPAFLMKAFQRGAPGIMVMGCEIPTCHYISGNVYASYRMELTRQLMVLAGLEPERLGVQWLSAAMGDKFAKTVTEFNTTVNSLGPVPESIRNSLELRAAAACADSERLRLLVGKLPELAEEGNKYGEQFTRHELNRILTETVADEFNAKKILILLSEGGKSVSELAEGASVPPPKVLRKVLELLRSGKIIRERMDGNTPIYTAVTQVPTVPTQRDTKPIEGGAAPARA